MAVEPTSSEESLGRDEQYQQLLELKEKVKALNVVIEEGSHAEDFKSNSPFFPVLNKTLNSMRESFNSDAHKASRDSRAEISHFLGREEGIKDVLSLIDDFTTRANSAEEEKKLAEDQIAELHSILGQPEGNTTDIGGSL